MKEKQGQHLHDVRELSFKEKKSDSFAAHFASHFPKGSKPSNYEIRQLLEYKILWQANPISCLKMFGTLECSLCMREHISKNRTCDHVSVRHPFLREFLRTSVPRARENQPTAP